jgi:hypothetical protein
MLSWGGHIGCIFKELLHHEDKGGHPFGKQSFEGYYFGYFCQDLNGEAK